MSSAGQRTRDSGPLPAFTIRRADSNDVDQVLRCLSAAFELYREQYTPEGYRDTVLTRESALRRFREMTVLVAENDSAEIIGTVAFCKIPPGEGHLRGMAVLPQHHGQGIAWSLLSAAERELRQQGCSRLTLDTTRPLERALRFYQRHGYRLTGIVRDFYGMPLLELAKDLE